MSDNKAVFFHLEPAYIASRTPSIYSGEIKLMLAILKDAIRRFRKNITSKSVYGQRIFDETEAWFFSNDSTYLYSFRSICAFLGLDPRMIRERLRETAQEYQQVCRL